MNATGTGGYAETSPANSRELFALTDEQILEMEEEVAGEQRPATREEGGEKLHTESAEGGAQRARRDGIGAGRQDAGATGADTDGKGAQAGMPVPQWLAERMNDPWHGDDAKELWEGKQKAEKEAAAYREVFATAEDARALKEIYPGGVNEAKSAAERARTLDEIDGMYFRGDAAARAQLAQKMMEQDPAAFREMVEAGIRAIEKAERQRSNEVTKKGEEKGLTTEAQRTTEIRGGVRGDGVSRGGADVEVLRDANDASLRMTNRTDADGAAHEVARAYGAFERATNAELEKSVGGTITRTIEQALPNLRQIDTDARAGARHAVPLQERLAGAVREEIDAALKSDAALGEQVARILAGRRFDDATRVQVVRLIDARAQQLVPGAVRRVVGSWTQATISARRGNGQEEAHADVRTEARGTKPASVARGGNERATTGRNEKRAESQPVRGRRVDYGKLSDEEILEL